MVENGDLMELKGDMIRRRAERCEMLLHYSAVTDSHNHTRQSLPSLFYKAKRGNISES